MQLVRRACDSRSCCDFPCPPLPLFCVCCVYGGSPDTRCSDLHLALWWSFEFWRFVHMIPFNVRNSKFFFVQIWMDYNFRSEFDREYITSIKLWNKIFWVFLCVALKLCRARHKEMVPARKIECDHDVHRTKIWTWVSIPQQTIFTALLSTSSVWKGPRRRHNGCECSYGTNGNLLLDE